MPAVPSGSATTIASVAGSVYLQINVSGPGGSDGCSRSFTIVSASKAKPIAASVRPDGALAVHDPAARGPYPSGSSVDLGSGVPDISADGRYVVFHSGAVDLVPGTLSGRTHIFRRDLQTNTTRLVSVNEEGVQNGGCVQDPSVSDDGRHVCFTYGPIENDPWGIIAPGDGNPRGQILVKNMQTGQLVHATQSYKIQDGRGAREGSAYYCQMSGDGSHVAFLSSYADIHPGKTAGNSTEVFVYRIPSGEMKHASVSHYTGEAANGTATDVGLNGDGCTVTFSTDATNLSPKNTYGVRQIYVHYFCGPNAGVTRMVTYNVEADRPFVPGMNSGLPQGSENPSISADGTKVIFTSYSPDVVSQTVNPGLSDIFVADLNTNTVRQVSVASDGRKGIGNSADPHISKNGRYAVFETGASNLVPGTTPGSGNAIIHDLVTRKTELLSYDQDGNVLNLPHADWGWANGGAPRVANNGTTAFHTLVPLVHADTNHMWDVYVSKPILSTAQALPTTFLASALVALENALTSLLGILGR